MAAGLMSCKQKHQEQEEKGCGGRQTPRSPEGCVLGKALVPWRARLASGWFGPQPGGPPSRAPLPAAGLEPRLPAWSPCSHWGKGPSTFHHDPESYFSSKSAQEARQEASCAGLE